MRRSAAAALLVLVTGCGAQPTTPATAGTVPVSAGPSATPSPAGATPTPSAAAARHLDLANLGLTIDLPGDWRVLTSRMGELEPGAGRELDGGLVLRRFTAISITGAGPFGLVAVRDAPGALLVVLARGVDEAGVGPSAGQSIDTPAGPAVIGPVDSVLASVTGAGARIDVPARDFDVELSLWRAVDPAAPPEEELERVARTLRAVGPPARTWTQDDATDPPVPDRVFEAWLPKRWAVGTWAGATMSGRVLFLLPVPAADGSALELCAAIAANPDALGVMSGTVTGQGGRSAIVSGCRVAGATSADFAALVERERLAGDRPAYAYTAGDREVRVVLAGEAVVMVTSEDAAFADAVTADLPAGDVRTP